MDFEMIFGLKFGPFDAVTCHVGTMRMAKPTEDPANAKQTFRPAA
jgi:hypothetical protein